MEKPGEKSADRDPAVWPDQLKVSVTIKQMTVIHSQGLITYRMPLY